MFVTLPIPIWLASRLYLLPGVSARIAGIAGAALIGIAVLAPLYAGTCLMAHHALSHNEPAYADVWIGFRRMYGRAFAVGMIQAFGTAVLLTNAIFYASHGGFAGLLASAMFLYMFLFWGVNCLYHIPLVVEADAGVIPRQGGGPPRIAAVLRNGFLLAASAPLQGFALLLVWVTLGIPLAFSGVGMALLFPGLSAFLMTRATRDHLTRFGLVAYDSDSDAPVIEDVWRV